MCHWGNVDVGRFIRTEGKFSTILHASRHNSHYSGSRNSQGSLHSDDIFSFQLHVDPVTQLLWFLMLIDNLSFYTKDH